MEAAEGDLPASASANFPPRLEHTVLNLAPFSLAAVSWFYLQSHQPSDVSVPGAVRWWKLAVSGALLSTEVVALLLWAPMVSNDYYDISIIASAVSCAADFQTTLALLTAKRPKGLHQVFILLILGVVSDVSKAHVYQKIELADLAHLSWAAAALRSVLLLLDDDWRCHVFYDFPKLIFDVFRASLFAENLEDLWPEYSSEQLSERFALAWSNANNASLREFCKILLHILRKPLLVGSVAQLSAVWLLYLKPALIKRVVLFIKDPLVSEDSGDDLLAYYGYLCIGILILRSIHGLMIHQSAIMLRGILLSHLFRKTLSIPHSSGSRQRTVRLGNTDIEELVDRAVEAHNYLGYFAEVITGACILVNYIGRRAFLQFIPFILCVVFGCFISRNAGLAWKRWEKAAQLRASATARALSQIPNFKAIGLQGSAHEYIQELRTAENEQFYKASLLLMTRVLSSVLAWALAPVTAVFGSFLLNDSDRIMAADDTCFIFAITTLIMDQLLEVMSCNEKFAFAAIRLREIHEYFVLEGVPQAVFSTQQGASALPVTSEINVLGCAAAFSRTTLWYTTGPKLILSDVSFNVPQSKVMLLVGPPGSGKSTVCRLISGEIRAQEGRIHYLRGAVGLCSQIPWLWNGSIRENILGYNIYERERYNVIVAACHLNDDLRRLPAGDLSLVRALIGKLSVSFQLRVALARAVYSRAPTIIMDDIISEIGIGVTRHIFRHLLGEDGILTQSGTTVILATSSMDYTKYAQSAVFLDGNGDALATSKFSALNFPSQYVDMLAVTEKRTTQSSGVVELGPTEAVSGRTLQGLRKDILRHLRFLFRSTNIWQVVIGVLSCVALSIFDHSPTFVLRAWLENGAVDPGEYSGYLLPVAAVLFAFFYAAWFSMLRVFPETVQWLFCATLDCAVRATLGFQSSPSMEYAVNSFGPDIYFISRGLPNAMHNVSYYGFYSIVDLCVALSAVKYAVLCLPILLAVLSVIHYKHLVSAMSLKAANNNVKGILSSRLADTIDGAEHIRGFGWERQSFRQSLAVLDRSQQLLYQSYAITRRLRFSLELFALLVGVAVVATILHYSWLTTEAAAGLSMVTLLTFGSNMGFIVPHMIDFEKILQITARIQDFVSQAPLEPEREHIRLPPKWPRQGEIKFTNVYAKYSPGEENVLWDISYTFTAGEKIALVGRPGSGKTSLLRTILNMLHYTGKIEIDGTDISTIPLDVLRSSITSISQEISELGGTVRDNLLPYKGQKESRKMHKGVVCEALEKVGLMGVVRAGGGIDASLASLNLSDAQKQLLCIARAMLHNAHTQSKIVLMDEATSHMDEQMDRHIQGVMGEAFAECTLIVVAERLHTFEDVDEYLMLDDGVRAVPDLAEVP